MRDIFLNHSAHSVHSDTVLIGFARSAIEAMVRLGAMLFFTPAALLLKDSL